jgi:hypothetical protein
LQYSRHLLSAAGVFAGHAVHAYKERIYYVVPPGNFAHYTGVPPIVIER